MLLLDYLLRVPPLSSCTVLLPSLRAVWYHVVSGRKVFLAAPPSPANLAAFEEWSTSGKQVSVWVGGVGGGGGQDQWRGAAGPFEDWPTSRLQPSVCSGGCVTTAG